MGGVRKTTGMDTLFLVRVDTADVTHTIPYKSVDECLQDFGLEALMQEGAVARVCFANGDRLTRDVDTWKELQEQVVSNSTTLLRACLQ